jgi:5-methylcytosine-specific restriction enzyme A
MSIWPYTTRQWERVRQQKMARDPLCEACLQVGDIVPAEVVDHRTPITREGREKRSAAEAFPHLDGLASLCARHHNAKTRAEQLGEKNWMLKGCDARGYPLDRNHPFYRKVKA